jgi:hypothetical protein
MARQPGPIDPEKPPAKTPATMVDIRAPSSYLLPGIG